MEYDKLGLVKLISAKTGNTQEETKKFLDALCEVFQEAILREDIISVNGFGRLYTTITSPRNGLDFDGNPKKFKEGKRVTFRVSDAWRRR